MKEKDPNQTKLISRTDKNVEVILECFDLIITFLNSIKPTWKKEKDAMKQYDVETAQENFKSNSNAFIKAGKVFMTLTGKQREEFAKDRLYSILCNNFSKLLGARKFMKNPEIFKDLNMTLHQWRYPSLETMKMALSLDKFADVKDKFEMLIHETVDLIDDDAEKTAVQDRFEKALSMLPDDFGTNASLEQALQEIERLEKKAEEEE